MYTKQDLLELRDFYQNRLLNNTIPFWFPKSFDNEYGGYLLMRDADGSLLDDDKSVWFQGRAAWILAKLYTTFGQNKEWLAGAKSGVDFLKYHCFDTDGQMFFHVTRNGQPIRKRRYFYSETFAVISYAAYAKASGDMKWYAEAERLFRQCINFHENQTLLPAKQTGTRPAIGFGVRIILINTVQQLRDVLGDNTYNTYIDKWIDEITRYFVKHDIRCVMEQVTPCGDIIDHIDGRMLNPGHALEGAWFIMEEACQRGLSQNQHLLQLACSMIDYMWERGWDEQHGGLFYFRDVYHKPVQEYWQDMKFWWPHNEAIIATLMAFLLTGNPKYAAWHKQVHDYAYAHFSDTVNGEWFGYLHRDGTVAQPAKGNMFKGPFHLPRQEWYCYQLLSDHLAGKNG